jgi:hypothetical protein
LDPGYDLSMINEHIRLRANELQFIGPHEPPPASGYAYNADFSELCHDGHRVALVDEIHPKGRYVDFTLIDWIGPRLSR